VALGACAARWIAPAPGVARVPEAGATAAATGAEGAPDHGGRRTWLLGHARTGRHQWVTGAVVMATPQSGEARLYVTTTGEKGTYRFEAMPEGTYRVRLLKHGLEPVTKDGVELKFPFRAVVEVVMKPTSGPRSPVVPAAKTTSVGTVANVVGRIVDREGEPVEEVRVRVTRADGSVDPRDTVSDENGEFAMTGLLPGAWTLEVLGAGYLPIRIPVTLSGEGELRAVLVPQPASYEPQPLDLMPPELPIPPPPFEPDPAPSGDAVADVDPAASAAERPQ
jgi:hypothetical protein